MRRSWIILACALAVVFLSGGVRSEKPEDAIDGVMEVGTCVYDLDIVI